MSKTTRLKSGAPAVVTAQPAPVAKPGDNVRAILSDITLTAANATASRSTLVDKVKGFADKPTKDQLSALQAAVSAGYMAGRIAHFAGRALATAEDIATATLAMAKAGANAAQANKHGKRSEAEERFYGGARVYWHGVMKAAGFATESDTGTGRSEGGKASAKARATRATTTTVGAVDVTPARAAPAKAAPAAQPVGKVATPMEAMAHVHAVAAALHTYMEANKALFLPKSHTAASKAIAALRALPVPTH